MTILGIDQLQNNSSFQKLVKGNIAYLCHSASLNSNLEFGVDVVKKIFGQRLKALFGPQHGIVSNVQDNMVETDHTFDDYYQVPIYSLYSETRTPTDKMLEGIDTVIVDLQDVGTRVYTYITTLSLLMEQCERLGVKVVVLDRPNPVGGETIEGNILEKEWASFVGHHPIPMRHALTIGEIAKLQKNLYCPNLELDIVVMKNWQRSMLWPETKLTWVNPSPNLATTQSALTFCGTVLFEGTNISEGRGTTRSLEQVGAPQINIRPFLDKINQELKKKWDIQNVILRPVQFLPMFQKHANKNCQGIFIHPQGDFLSWRLGQILLHYFYHQDEFSFEWSSKPYEYQFENLAIDYINGSEAPRLWVESSSPLESLIQLEKKGYDKFLNLRENVLLY